MINSYSNKLKEFNEYLYDHIIIFCTSESDPRIIKSNYLLEFFDSGRNLLIAGDIDTSKVYRQLFNSFGVDIDVIVYHIFFIHFRDQEFKTTLMFLKIWTTL
jgi:hypothetical protein